VNWLDSILGPLGGLILILAAAIIMLIIFSRIRKKTQKEGPRVVFHSIRAMRRLRRAIGLAVENGTRLHISIGKASIISPNNASALIGLSTLERVGILSSVSDRPPVVTSGEGTLALLSQDTLHAAYRISNVPERQEQTQARLAGVTPFSYVAGTLPIVHDERVSAHILVGNFGPEIALLTDAAERENSFVLAASDSSTAQSVLYATASEALIGEELFAIPAYLQAGAMHQAGLRTQDILRWVLIAVLVIGAVWTFLQSLL
jgi:hypothetical protein